MSYLLYVSNLPPEITLDDLKIYFQSSKSGGGDVDDDACDFKHDDHSAVIAFEEKECLESVLKKRSHEVKKHKLKISDKPEPPSKGEEETQTHDDIERTYLGEVRTVIVEGLSPKTTDEAVQLYFQNLRRSGGGEIEKMERCQPDIAHITFFSAEVASRVLENGTLELEEYRLRLKEKLPELILPKDRKKLYVENIDSNTTTDSLTNYFEVKTGVEVCGIQDGSNRDALITFDGEPDIEKMIENEKPLEGAVLKISNPPVCNTILITGLKRNTTKDLIEMYFENRRNGGGKIYGDVIYQKEKAKAVVSFCDPHVVETITEHEHNLNGARLTISPHYQFMNTITETTYRTIKINSDVLDHAINKCEEEIRDQFGAETLEVIQGKEEEFLLPEEVAKEIKKFMEQFTVEEIPFCKKLLDASKDELKKMVTTANDGNVTIAIEEELPQMKIVGMKKCTKETYEHFKNKISEMEKELDVASEQVSLSEDKLELFLLHGADNMLKNKFHVRVKIEPTKGNITIEGPKEQVSLAVNEAYKKCSQIVEHNIDLSQAEKHFLESGGLGVLNNGMKSKGLKGMIFLDGKIGTSKAKVTVFEGTTTDDVQSYLSRNMSVKKFSLDEDSLTLLKSNKWKEFCENSKAEISVTIYTSAKSSSTEILLVGRVQDVEKTHETLNKFMTRNTIVKESVDLEEGCVAYLAQHRKKDLEEIKTKLQEHSVRMHLMEHEGKVNIDGTKEGVKEARKYVQDIISNIARGKMCFDKLRAQEYLESEQGKLSMEGIETKHSCSIRLIKDDGERSTIVPPRPKQPSKLLCSYETREKISLKVFNDDIVKHSCDVMVNAANSNLKHVGGVAKSILDAGGREIQDECDAHVNTEGSLFDGESFSGSPGKLPCKRLIHAVSPRWDVSKSEKICKTLRFTCRRVFEKAMDCQSIAIPAIGSGIFGIPKETCAEIMIEAAEEFAQKNPNSALKDIHFVNNDDVTCQVFLRKFREKFRGRPTFTDSLAMNYSRSRFGPSKSRFQRKDSKPKKEPESASEPLPQRKSGDFIITQRNMKISVVCGDLSTYKAEVLVNTTGENLQLDSNPCSKALSKEAGPILQAECSKIGKLEVGQVAVTSGGGLLCDKVYHVSCVQWNGGQGEQVLRSIVENCLNKCNSNGKDSIAFPAIGTGILGFPHDVAAKIFFEETKKFEKKIQNCKIKEVSFVVYNQDAKSIEAFKSELKKQQEWDNSESAVAVPVPILSKRRMKRMNMKSTSTKSDSPTRSATGPEGRYDSVMCVKIGKDNKMEIAKGEITKETTDVIAHLTNPGLSLNSSVGKALAEAGGANIRTECQAIANFAKLDFEKTVLTTAGKLDAKYVAHMVSSNDPTYNEIENCITNCLVEASERGCESISFPPVDTGSLKYDPSKAAAAILTSVTRFLNSSPGSLRLVRIVLEDDDLLTVFQTSAKKVNGDEGPGMLKKFVNFFWKSDSTTISVKEKPAVTRKKVSLEIYAKDDDTVALVKKRIKNLLEHQNKKKSLEDDNIEKLSGQQEAEIEELCYKNDVKVTIDKDVNRIIVFGHGDDISKTFDQIHKILRGIGEEEKEKEKAALHADWAEVVSQAVQWFYFDPVNGDHEEYDKQTNAMIEKAYSKKEKSVIFFLGNENCEIVFDDMQETNLDTNEVIEVIRKDLKAEVPVPDYWEPQPKDANGKELVVHLVTLNPNDPKHKAEHKKISDHFRQTASQQNILQIQRVQNPSLLKLYLLKKQSLDDKNGSNEKFLFHGTKGNKLIQINEKGLNRGYAGNTNGAVYGKGVYFAKDASMSVGYAPAMPDGKRYMYYTRAAVGQCTVGNKDLVEPPPKGGSGSDSYDSTVNNVANPTIFVLFYDNQYYPEYLITFN